MQFLTYYVLIYNVIGVTAFAPKVTTKVTPLTTTTETTTSPTQLYNDLWGEPPNKDGQNTEMSKSLPFVPRPKLLDGSLPGDVGFE
jgi:hypothetical protein